MDSASGFTPLSGPTPTVYPLVEFDGVVDAEHIHKALKDPVEENTIYTILCQRANHQRMMIRQSYRNSYDRDVIRDIRNTFRCNVFRGGNFGRVLVALMLPHYEYQASLIREAIENGGSYDEILADILCTGNNTDMRCVSYAYKEVYKRPLGPDLEVATSAMRFRRLCIALAEGRRMEKEPAEAIQALLDAQALHRAGSMFNCGPTHPGFESLGLDKLVKNESAFTEILASRSLEHLKLVFSEYSRLYKVKFEDAINNHFSGILKAGLLAILESTLDKPRYYARRLHETMISLKPNDPTLIHLIVTRCELDLANVAEAYEKLYAKPLYKAIGFTTTGPFKKTLQMLLGKDKDRYFKLLK